MTQTHLTVGVLTPKPQPPGSLPTSLLPSHQNIYKSTVWGKQEKCTLPQPQCGLQQWSDCQERNCPRGLSESLKDSSFQHMNSLASIQNCFEFEASREKSWLFFLNHMTILVSLWGWHPSILLWAQHVIWANQQNISSPWLLKWS